jgi:hypothetical protein
MKEIKEINNNIKDELDILKLNYSVVNESCSDKILT